MKIEEVVKKLMRYSTRLESQPQRQPIGFGADGVWARIGAAAMKADASGS